MRRLVVCDIDGTLIELTAAELDVFFGTFERAFGIPPVKREWARYVATNDYAIIRTVLHEHFGRHGTAAEIERFRRSYLDGLTRGFADGSLRRALVAGVADLLQALAARDDVGLSLATANMRDGALLRLEAAGLWSHFAGGAFAEDGLHKPAILAAALRRAEARWGAAMRPETVVYLGDSPADAVAAQAAGAAFVGIATRPERRERLTAAGADVVLEGFASLDDALAAIVAG